MPDYNVVIKGRLKATDEQDQDLDVNDIMESLVEIFDNNDIDVEYTDDDDNDEVATLTLSIEDTEVTPAAPDDIAG